MNQNPKLEHYIEQLSTPETNLLKEIRKNTFLKTTHPHMISGHIQGKFLSMISLMINPKNILEIGTFTGYSTLCLLEGLQQNGKITTIDNNAELEGLCKESFEKHKKSNLINYLLGDAKKIIPNLNDEYDLIFIDADKENYSNYLDLVKPKLKKGGFILADNVLWYGKVTENTDDKATNCIKEFNKKVNNDSDLEVVILPIRDGISIIRKI
ncbi:MAG: class I SAM-dependent methyltransferase [Flavobacteriales bacterium]|nr:class I SAM-dependent methyltransferase [Flavobacteriales bacterium]